MNFIGTCEGNCYQYASFGSLGLVGGTGGVRCIAYSDYNCQDEIVDTGDVDGKGKCTDAKDAQSVVCYSGC